MKLKDAPLNTLLTITASSARVLLGSKRVILLEGTVGFRLDDNHFVVTKGKLGVYICNDFTVSMKLEDAPPGDFQLVEPFMNWAIGTIIDKIDDKHVTIEDTLYRYGPGCKAIVEVFKELTFKDLEVGVPFKFVYSDVIYRKINDKHYARNIYTITNDLVEVTHE